jgi:hypothetical protein
MERAAIRNNLLVNFLKIAVIQSSQANRVDFIANLVRWRAFQGLATSRQYNMIGQ